MRALPEATPETRVLVVDDDPGVRRFTTRALVAAGFAVTEAAGGHEAIMLALTDSPDLVLLDLGLPDLDGEQVLRRLQHVRPRQRVLVWSATADRDAEHRCRSLGARGYLHKPVSLAELVSCVRRDAAQDTLATLDDRRCGSTGVGAGSAGRSTTTCS
ncbi:MAG TPA: response regulator [Nocardioidaceae bacterium]|nr:response regulator [Nocardioidaceae bacterium]